jgi:hypothetical protein
MVAVAEDVDVFGALDLGGFERRTGCLLRHAGYRQAEHQGEHITEIMRTFGSS